MELVSSMKSAIVSSLSPKSRFGGYARRLVRRPTPARRPRLAKGGAACHSVGSRHHEHCDGVSDLLGMTALTRCSGLQSAAYLDPSIYANSLWATNRATSRCRRPVLSNRDVWATNRGRNGL